MTSIYILLGILLLSSVLQWHRICKLQRQVGYLIDVKVSRAQSCKHIRRTFTNDLQRICGECGVEC